MTSHHEDLLFKVKIQGYNPITKQEIVGLNLITFPIKVISKPEQLKKRPPSKKRSLTDMLVETVSRIEKRQDEQQKLIEKVLTVQKSTPTLAPLAPTLSANPNLPLSSPTSSSSPSLSSSSSSSYFSLNSNTNPNVNANLPPSSFVFSPVNNNMNVNPANFAISNRDDELAFWETFLPTSANVDMENQDVSSVFGGSNSSSKDGKSESNPPVDFELAFGELVKAYNAMSSDEKPEKIRKLIRNSSTRDTERLSELLDLFWTDGLLKEHSGFGSRTMAPGTTVHSGPGGSNQSNQECQCQDVSIRLLSLVLLVVMVMVIM